MKALRLYKAFDLRFEEVEDPRPPEGWALIKTIAVGVCGTDKAFYTGSYPLFKSPLIPGHEVVGVVVSRGPLEGSIVVSEINFPCGKCYYCRMGLYTHCPYKKTLGIDFDGGFAEYFTAPIQALHNVDGIDPVVATEVEPLAAVLNAFEQYPPTPMSKVAVIGTGNIAYLATQVLISMGLQPIVIARRGSPKVAHFKKLNVDVVYVDEVREYVAIVFGSFVEENVFRDVDITVYSYAMDYAMDLDKLLKINFELELELGILVDIVPLDQLNLIFRLKILRKGLVVEKPGVFECFFMLTCDELEVMRIALNESLSRCT